VLTREITADIQEAQKTGDVETEAALTPRLNELTERERALYPPMSPYFHDSRSNRTPTGGARRQ
jgi:hypothetical protein